ncbi:uncharacterized protein CLUP02_05156 [Colletotrichum lupini]|uniref:Uncharacterized protein n=1 Tax=Colletotrichum lupini TaxID=145971 RepID=A0A9Q8SMS8_9PEZI|nr:uncharacterized protein CLUP02_05156 [Colletotrichum lupini]UQC79676.1 hypothetical protein CLUP02_05156 [Colletotrichum lupini]
MGIQCLCLCLSPALSPHTILFSTGLVPTPTPLAACGLPSLLKLRADDDGYTPYPDHPLAPPSCAHAWKQPVSVGAEKREDESPSSKQASSIQAIPGPGPAPSTKYPRTQAPVARKLCRSGWAAGLLDSPSSRAAPYLALVQAFLLGRHHNTHPNNVVCHFARKTICALLCTAH